jgi:hypothetical protein
MVRRSFPPQLLLLLKSFFSTSEADRFFIRTFSNPNNMPKATFRCNLISGVSLLVILKLFAFPFFFHFVHHFSIKMVFSMMHFQYFLGIKFIE